MALFNRGETKNLTIELSGATISSSSAEAHIDQLTMSHVIYITRVEAWN